MAAPTGKRYSRRTFLTGLGVGLGTAGAAGVATGVSLGRIDLRNREIVSGNFKSYLTNCSGCCPVRTQK